MISNLIAKILLILFLIAAPFLSYGFGKQLLELIRNSNPYSPKIMAFLIGIAAFFPAWLFLKRYLSSIWNYLTTLEHECTHALIGLLFGKIPVSMRVSAWEGGEVKLRGGSNLWISLAPYFFPTLSFLVLIPAFIFSFSDSLYFYALLGFTIAFHIITNWQETSFRQPDLKKAGYLTSILVLPVANLITYGAILSFIFGGANAFYAFFISGGRGAWGAAVGLFK